MVASVLKRGNVAIVSYASDPIGPDGDDILRFVIMTSIGSGTQIFFSDRNWNGTAFPAASAGEGTFTYTAGADLPAGTVITITSAQLLAAGMDLSNNGDTVYVYQGTDANTPTTFLFAIDFGDGNSVFEAGELTGTGLTAGVDAVAVAHDQASFAGQSTQIPQTQLAAISNNVQWHGHSGDDIGGTIYDDRADVTLSGPLNNADMQLFGMMSGGGQSDAFIRMDNDEGANVATNLTRLFRDNPAFTHLTDLAFDIEDGFWFAVDNDGGTVTRLIRGNISDLVSGTSSPTITQIYDFPNNDADSNDDSFIDGIEIDTAGNRVYFIQGDIAAGHNLKSIAYTGGAVTDYGAISFAFDQTIGIFTGGIFDFTLDVPHNTAYFTYVLVDTNFNPPRAHVNYLVKVNALNNPAGGYSIVPINGGDDPDGGGTNPGNHFPDVANGSLAGIDIDIANQRLYFVTQRLGANGQAGVFMYDIVTHNFVQLWVQQSNNATNTLQPFPTTQMEYIEVDTIGGRYYVSTLNNTDTAVGHDGTATDEGGSRIFSGALATTAGQPAPTPFASVFENTANGAVLGMEIDYAPTTSIASVGSTYTESTNLPGSPAGPTVDVGASPTVSDPDQTIIQGATVAITTGFVSGDQLTFTNSGGITGSYNSTTGVITFTGNASFAAYQTVLDSVRYTNAGDNPTDYGASTSRMITFTVFDGLLNSDPAFAAVTVVGINDAPVNTVQGAALGISEDAVNAVLSTTGNAISVFDVDANPATQDIRVTLSVTQGTLTILTSVIGGIIAGDITGGANGTNTITITATQNQINATLAASNGLLYNPIADYNGSDTLTIVTNDLGLNGNDAGLTGDLTSEQDSDSRTINIAAVVDIANDTVNIGEDAGAQNLNLLSNDSFENAGRAITAVGTASHGTVTINNNGTPGVATDDFVVYTATADYNGSDSFTYTVTSGGVTEQATVTVNISAVQDIAADTIPLNEDAGPSQLDLLANDSFENAGRSITAVGTASHGTVTINNNGTPGTTSDDYVVYTPTADYNGSDSFTYTVTSGGVTEQATATINIAAVADIADDSVTVAEDSGTNHLNGIGNPVSLLANDSFENAGRAITAVGAALHGTTAINNNGTAGDATDDYVTYTPTGNYAGPDSFTYTVTSGGVTETATVTVNVTAVNDDPINTKPGTQTINEDATLTFSTAGGNAISVSDIDAAPGMLTVTLAVLNGQLTLGGTFGLTFAVGGGDGTDDTSMTFTGTATDINAALNGLLYETTLDYNGSDTLTITTNDNGNTGTPGALQDMDTVTINITAVADIANDTLSFNEDSGTHTLTMPNNDTFENPGRSITAVTQGLHGFVAINDNNTIGDTTDDYIVYTQAADYYGTDSFTYTVTSGGVTETATVNVNISPVADIANDTPTVGEDSGATTIDVIANDSFENGGFSITAVTQGLHGTVTIIDGPDLDTNPDYVTYTPTADYYGADSFTYTVTSGGVTETATVNVTVTAVADIADDTVGVIQDSGVNALNLLANDTFENAGRGITAVGAALHGTVAINNNGTPGNVTDDFVTYTPTGGYIGPDTFTYTVTSGGATETATVSVNVAPANLAPVVDLNGTDGGIDFASAYTEDGTAAVIADTDVSITDADAGDDIVSATITITDAIAGDQLTVLGALPGSIVATGGGTASITLSGTGTQAEYQTALTQIRYSSTSNDPTAGGTDLTRSVSVTVNDGEASSTPAAVTTVTITASNDPPAGTDATITAVEDTPRLLALADFGFTDPDSADTLSAVTITGVTGGTLYYDADGTGGAGLPVAVGSFPQTYTAAELAAGNVSYQANSNLNGTGVGTISFQVIDNSGAPNNTDLSVNTLTVDVTPINDQPNIPNSPTVTTDEQVAVTLNAAITVTDVDLDARNGGNGDYSGAAFAINRSVSDAEDVFSFNTTGAQFTVNGSNLESGGNVIATLAQAGGILNINFVDNGTVPTTALVNDVLQHLQYTNTSNEPPASVTLIYIIDDGAPGGGQGALGAPFNNIDGGQVTININSVNDAPSGADKLITIDEDANQVLTTADFGFSDIDNDIFDSAVVVSVTGGTILVDDGNILTPPVSLTSGTISAADIAAGYVSFQPTAHLNGSGAGAISFQVVDNGGTANSGQDTDQSANTITFDIDSVNDAPSGTDNTVTGSEDDPYVFTLADFGYSDPADSDAFAGVIFTTVPTTGTLFYDADGPGGAAPVALADGAGPIAAADIAAGKVYFVPVIDAFGSPYTTLTFQVQDDGGITNGGVDTDQSANTITINIAPDNLPPVVDLDGATGGLNYTTSYTEDAPGVAIGSGVIVSDPDSGFGDMIESAVITLTDRVTGDALTLTGVLPPGFLAATNIAAGSITLTITGSGTGAQYQALIESILYSTTNQNPTVGGTDAARTITVVVNDGTINSATATTTVNISALDDAPVAQPDAYTITESGMIVAGNLFADNGSGTDSDPDGPPLAVSAVGGGPGANVGSQFTLDSGATLTVHADGTFDYNPGSVFLPTPTAGSGASNTPSHDSFTYTVAGGNTVTVNIALTGLDTNDLLLGTSGADTMDGGIGQDALFGGAGPDILRGGDGNDAIEGGTGTDGMYGGTGNDVFYVDQASDYLVEAGAEGTDLVYASVSYGLTAGVEVEILSTTQNSGTGPIDLYGNEFDNIIYGNAGANLLNGDGGNDVLVGLGGADLLIGDDGNDTLDGGAGNNTLFGGAGVDILLGGDNDDVLDGGTGADGLYGGDGNDSYYVDQAGDFVLEAANRGTDIVYASASYALAAGSSVEILSTTQNSGTGAINLTGNELDNVIYGNAGMNLLIGGAGNDVLVGLGDDDRLIGDNGTDTLDGGGGNDTLLGGALGDTLLGGDGEDVIDGGTGADGMYGGDGNDVYIVDDALDAAIEASGQGTDAVYTTVSYTLAAGSSVEILSTTQNSGTGAIDLTGNEFANILYGNAAVNILNGLDGNDAMVGGGGADIFQFTTALGANNVDGIGDFVHGTDKIWLDNAVFTALSPGALVNASFHVGATATDEDQRILYDSTNGNLYYDEDGTGATAAILFANLQGNPTLTASDFQVI